MGTQKFLTDSHLAEFRQIQFRERFQRLGVLLGSRVWVSVSTFWVDLRSTRRFGFRFVLNKSSYRMRHIKTIVFRIILGFKPREDSEI